MMKFCSEGGIKECLEISFKLCFQRQVPPLILKLFSAFTRCFYPHFWSWTE